MIKKIARLENWLLLEEEQGGLGELKIWSTPDKGQV